MRTAPIMLACLALAACSHPVACITATQATLAQQADATGNIEDSKGVHINVTKADNSNPYVYKLLGVMENVSGHVLSSVTVQCKFKDKDGHTISADDDYAYNMEPGEAKNLSIEIFGEGVPAAWSCAVREAR